MKEGNIPLFLHVTDPLALIVVDNVIIARQRSVGTVLYPFRSLELLLQLYSNPAGKIAIPKRLHAHLASNELQSMVQKSHCLLGIDEDIEPDVLYLCLNFDMYITQEQDTPVLLKNFSYNKENLNYELKLAASDIFHILANICVEQQLHRILSHSDLLEKPIFRSDMFIYSDDSANTRFFRFVGEYIDFMREQIISGTISLFDILKLGGIPIFQVLYGITEVCDFINNAARKLMENYEELSRTEKIVFYALVRCIWTYSQTEFSNIEKLFLYNKKVIKKLLYDLWPMYPSLLSDWLE
ncbi:MAG: hypothetical protein ACTSPO_13160 [Candidatus Heimdallarchaeaceae archaeon]